MLWHVKPWKLNFFVVVLRSGPGSKSEKQRHLGLFVVVTVMHNRASRFLTCESLMAGEECESLETRRTYSERVKEKKRMRKRVKKSGKLKNFWNAFHFWKLFYKVSQFENAARFFALISLDFSPFFLGRSRHSKSISIRRTQNYESKKKTEQMKKPVFSHD